MDPWNLELIVVTGARMTGGERRAISRDVERGVFHRVRQGVFVARAAWDAATGWEGERAQHIVAMRALDAVAASKPVFSHRSGSVLHRNPIRGRHLDRVHTTVPDERLRGIDGVSAHCFPLRDDEVTTIGGLLVTTLARTVVDVAGSSPFRGGVMIADAALHSGLPRAVFEAAADLAGPRKAARRIDDVIAFAHKDAESATESETRVSQYEIGIAPQELQHELWYLGRLVARFDPWDPDRRIACEADGDQEYLDPRMAPKGAGPAIIQEKKREDLARSLIRSMARFGYREAANPPILRPVLVRAGLLPEQRRPTLSDYAAVALAADTASHQSR